MAGLNGNITIKSSEYRSCIVYGEKALFHKWENKEQLVFKFNILLTQSIIDLILEKYKKTNVIPCTVTTHKIRTTLAIVEFEDGVVKEVEPASIKFLDSGNLFYEQHFNIQKSRTCAGCVYDKENCKSPMPCERDKTGNYTGYKPMD